MSSCVENSQNYTLMFHCSPIPGKRFEKQGKLWDRFVPQFFHHFMTFSPWLETNVALQCSSDSFSHMLIYILCLENCQNYISMHSCLPIVGRLFYNMRKLHWSRIWEFNLGLTKVFWAAKSYLMSLISDLRPSPPNPHPPPSLVWKRTHFPLFFLTLPLDLFHLFSFSQAKGKRIYWTIV